MNSALTFLTREICINVEILLEKKNILPSLFKECNIQNCRKKYRPIGDIQNELHYNHCCYNIMDTFTNSYVNVLLK